MIAERTFEIIGEASKRLSDTFKEKYSDVAWKEVAGMRDFVIHHYNDVNYHILVDTYNSELGNLEKICEDYLVRCGLTMADINRLQSEHNKNVIKGELIDKLLKINNPIKIM